MLHQVFSRSEIDVLVQTANLQAVIALAEAPACIIAFIAKPLLQAGAAGKAESTNGP